MLLRVHIVLALALSFAALVAPVSAVAEETNSVWMVWERRLPAEGGCKNAAECGPSGVYRSHQLENVQPEVASRIFGQMANAARILGKADVPLQNMPFCRPEDRLQFMKSSHDLDLATPVDTLHGLKGIFVDVRGVRGPATFRGDFGIQAQTIVERYLREAGIPVLNKEQMRETPGQPELTMRYAVEVHGCRPWSVSMSLKQNVLLARAPDYKIKVSTWSASQRQSEADADFSELMAIEGVILSFIEAYNKANTTEAEKEAAQKKDG